MFAITAFRWLGGIFRTFVRLLLGMLNHLFILMDRDVFVRTRALFVPDYFAEVTVYLYP